jgi:hypothetical protein
MLHFDLHNIHLLMLSMVHKVAQLTVAPCHGRDEVNLLDIVNMLDMLLHQDYRHDLLHYMYKLTGK